MIQIMKASAGSGKTFNLARKYITLLFRKQDRSAFRHILAVTFTNKATDEMKNRILRELYRLSSDPASSGYIKWFMPWKFSDAELADVDPDDVVKELPGRPGEEITLDSIRECAREMLYNILHDYSAFSISTIDRFFQQTLKAFSREIGQFASYQVELDKDALVNETVDRIFDSLTEDDRDLLKWLTDCAIDQVESGKKYDIARSLATMAKRLRSDEYRTAAEAEGIDESSVYAYSNLTKVRSICRSVRNDFCSRLSDCASKALSAIVECGLSEKDFTRGFPKALREFAGIRPGEAVKRPDTFLKYAADRDMWFPKSRKTKAEQAVSSGLEDAFSDVCRIFGEDFKVYNTACLIYSQLYELGLHADISREFDAVLKDRNVLGIDDSNLILKNIIDGSDAPFVYEKTGVRYENFLLDEFQDTSGIQWENFRPLLENSVSQNFDCLVVGDVKQSIYRWRGSDWKLLQHSLEAELPHCRTTVLDSNFRSRKNIVEFNNDFFTYAAGELDRVYGSGTAVSDIYSDVRQKVTSAALDPGMVEATFCNEDAESDIVVRTIRNLVAGGARYGDIAVLVRNNDSGEKTAEVLIGDSIPVLTDDSLKISSSGMVRQIVSMLSAMDNPQDTASGFAASSLNADMPDSYRSLPDLCEALIRSLKDAGGYDSDAQATYIQSFMDCVMDFSARNGNSIHDFLEYWNEKVLYVTSPSLSDAVRIITVHKSKGLDFDYVIFPYAEKVDLFRKTDVWCCPDFSGTALEPAGRGLYDVTLSVSSVDTLFEKDFMKERLMQIIDNVNIFYVALTRAVKGMHIISVMPPAKLTESADGEMDFKNMSQILYAYIRRHGVRMGFREGEYGGEDAPESYRLGEMPRRDADKMSGPEFTVVPAAYPSFPLNPEHSADDGPAGNRLVLSTDSLDYFSEDGRSGLYSSGRMRGVILHRILSEVREAEDLDKAVRNAVASGLLDEEESAAAAAFLKSKIESVEPEGWFSGGKRMVLNEVSMIDSDGSVYRPDRVMVGADGKVTVIDYKFGARDSSHSRQILKYADMWERKGYCDVSACLWYVMEDSIERVK